MGKKSHGRYSYNETGLVDTSKLKPESDLPVKAISGPIKELHAIQAPLDARLLE